MSKETEAQIYGQTFTFSDDLDPAYVERLARAVDDRMRALAAQNKSLDTRRLAILTALNLADELEQLREKTAKQRPAVPGEFAQRLEACNRRLDSVLRDTESG